MEILGIFGGVLFFSSWLLQAWETKKAGKAVVSFKFFLIRILASVILCLESIRVGSIGLTLVNGATVFLMFYNLCVISRNKE